jgi:hypothetical protein
MLDRMSQIRNYVIQMAQDALNDLMADSDWRERIETAVSRFRMIQRNEYYMEGVPLDVRTSIDRVIEGAEDP